MDIDIVIPWIDWSSIPLRENMIRHGGHPEGIITNSNDKYEELKYLLRSIVKNKIKYRKIFIVHSDLNKPPSYLVVGECCRFELGCTEQTCWAMSTQVKNQIRKKL